MKTSEQTTEIVADLLGDGLLLYGGGGILTAGLITMLSSAHAFSARVLNAAAQADATHALHLKSLSASLVDMQAQAVARSAAGKTAAGLYTAGVAAATLPAGAPVVT